MTYVDFLTFELRNKIAAQMWESCFIISLFQRLSHACIQLAPDLLGLGPLTAEQVKVRPSSGLDRRLGKQWDIRSAYYDKPPLELRGYNKRGMGVDTHADNVCFSMVREGF